VAEETSFHTTGNASAQDLDTRAAALELFRSSPLPDAELLWNLGLYTSRLTTARTLFMTDLYRRALDVHGVVMEFGVRWGRDLALFQSLRGIYEPYNYTRTIVGFDTFSGFPSISEHDGDDAVIQHGAYGVSEGYEEYLEQLLAVREQESPIGHIRKFELVKGDVTETLPAYLDAHPETVVALAYFDMDIYEPTLAALELLRDRFTKGTVIGFDEVGVSAFPGETVALREALGLNNIRLQRSPVDALPSFMIWE
jgi:hypothetical protein